MNQGAQQNAQWNDAAGATDEDDAIAFEAQPRPDFQPPIVASEPLPESRRPARLGIGLLALAALAWIGLLTWGIVAARPADGLPLLKLAAWIGLGSGPLALLAVLALLLRAARPSDGAAAAASSARLHADGAAMTAMLALLTERIDQARGALAAEAATLDRLSEQAGARLGATAAALRGEAQAFGSAALTFDDATARARADLGVVMTDLPRLEDVARLLGERLREDSAEADQRSRALNSLLIELEARARAASEATGGAAARLAAQLERIEASAAAADRRIEDAAIAMGRAVDITMETVADGVEETRKAIATQSIALTALMAQGRSNLAAAADESVGSLSGQLDALVARVGALGAGISTQDDAARALLRQLEQAMEAVETRFVALREAGSEQVADLAEAMASLADHADAVDRTLGGSNQVAETLLGRVSQMRSQAEASSVAICETIPGALSRVRLHAEQSLQAIAGASQRAEGLSEVAHAVTERLAAADGLLERQKGALDEVGALAGSRLEGLHTQTEALEALLAKAAGEVSALAEGATGQLVDALLRVRDTASQASDHARDAISAVIPRVAQRLGESAARTLAQTISEVGQAEIAGIAAASEQAIEGARQAAERLARQLVTIAETSTAIEARITENRAETEAHDDASFARSISLLIDALNSTAIDVAKIFSNEVTDDQWKAYLRGDRGIFTRRAVRLLDRTEASQIAARYGEDLEFNDQVNRYIHDFEALLRRVMSTREGVAIATTMLSSDAGKLYVALAQAIERIRR